MEPDRSGDVVSWVLEEPDPPPRRPNRRRRLAIAATASLLAAGGLAAGASALTGSSDEGARPAKTSAAKPRPKIFYTADGVPTVRSGHECRAGKGRKAHRRAKRGAAAARY
jgi:hypothetical protein